MFLLVRNDLLQLVREVQRQPLQAISYAFILLFLFNIYTTGLSFITFLQQNTNLAHVIGLDQPRLFPVKAFIYWTSFDLIIRLLLQPLVGLDIARYKRLPFSTIILTNYIFCKNLLNLYSIYPFLLLPALSTLVSTQIETMLLFVCLIVICNTSLIFLIKSRISRIWLVGLFLVIGIYALGDGILLTEVLTEFELRQTLFIFLLIGSFTIGLYILNYRWLKNNLYLDAFDTQLSNSWPSSFIHLPINAQFVWSLVELDIRLILRNRRPKQFFLANAILSTICTVWLSDTFLNQPVSIFHFIMASVLGGFVLMSHQQLMFGWEGTYFDGLLARPISLVELFQAKRTLFTANCVLIYSLWLPFFWDNSLVFLLLVCSFLFNAGINANILLLFSLLNRSTIDLSQRTLFNYQGINSAQVVGVILITGLPAGFLLGIEFITHVFWIALFFVGLMSTICLLFRERILNLIIYLFAANKYHLAESFRDSRP